MRSRERLITVLKTVNKNVHPLAEPVLWGAAIHLEGRFTRGCGCDCVNELRKVRRMTLSPHIHELATEALHYIQEGC